MTDFLLMVGGALFAMFISGIVNYKKSVWVDLTDEEILSWWSMDNGLEDLDMCSIVDFRKVVEEVQTKLKEKNT